MRLLLVVLLLVAVAEGMPSGFGSVGDAVAHIDLPCDGDEQTPIASTFVIGVRHAMLPAIAECVLVDRVLDRPALRPPIA